MRFAKAVVKSRTVILILALLLLIPSVMGMARTRINYDMLDYLPADMDTVIGQNVLMEDFGKGAFSFIVVEGMPDGDVAALVLKGAGIAVVSELGTQLCADAGERALAGRIALAARLATLGLCAPMLSCIAGLVGEGLVCGD